MIIQNICIFKLLAINKYKWGIIYADIVSSCDGGGENRSSGTDYITTVRAKRILTCLLISFIIGANKETKEKHKLGQKVQRKSSLVFNSRHFFFLFLPIFLPYSVALCLFPPLLRLLVCKLSGPCQAEDCSCQT